jgi:hypothetical protein
LCACFWNFFPRMRAISTQSHFLGSHLLLSPPAAPDKPITRTNKHFSSNTGPFHEIFGFT